MKNVLYICIGALFAVLAFGSCNDAIDIRQDYDFSLSSWYLQEQIETGETVEIRFFILTVKGTMKRRSMKSVISRWKARER